MAYQKLSPAAQARARATLLHVEGGVVSDRLQRAIEEDHFARTLLGLPVQAVEVRLAALQRQARPTPGGASPPGP